MFGVRTGRYEEWILTLTRDGALSNPEIEAIGNVGIITIIIRIQNKYRKTIKTEIGIYGAGVCCTFALIKYILHFGVETDEVMTITYYMIMTIS